jgi:hypothetical protein
MVSWTSGRGPIIFTSINLSCWLLSIWLLAWFHQAPPAQWWINKEKIKKRRISLTSRRGSMIFTSIDLSQWVLLIWLLKSLNSFINLQKAPLTYKWIMKRNYKSGRGLIKVSTTNLSWRVISIRPHLDFYNVYAQNGPLNPKQNYPAFHAFFDNNNVWKK